MVDPVDRRSGSGSKPAENQPQPEVSQPQEVQPQEVQQEPEHHHDIPPHGQLPKPDMNLLMQMIFEQAMFALGQIPGIPEEEQRVDLNLAAFQIGLLEVVQQKTKGNLSTMEEKYLDEFLHQARLAFVTVQKQVETKK